MFDTVLIYVRALREELEKKKQNKTLFHRYPEPVET